MTATASPATASAPRRSSLVIGVVVVVGALLMIGALSANNPKSEIYDPASTRPLGTKALVELVSAFGTQVEVPDHFPADADAEVAVLFQDVVPVDQVEAVRDWVRSGHILVVTDPTSELTPKAVPIGLPINSGSTIDRGVCNVDAMHNVDQLDLGASPSSTLLGFRDPAAAPGAPAAQLCFTVGDGALLTVTSEGRGLIVSIASGVMFLNQNLGGADNAVLATDLFAPTPGTRLAILGTSAFGADGGGSPADISGSIDRIITPGVSLLLIQVLAAAVIYALARGRRLGRPVPEPQPVQIAGSELVSAVGNLWQQLKDPVTPSRVLRADLRRTLAERMGLSPEAPPEVLAEAISARTGLSRDEAYGALVEQPVSSDRDFVAVAQSIDAVREEILHDHTP
jgi:hypothetical protein